MDRLSLQMQQNWSRQRIVLFRENKNNRLWDKINTRIKQQYEYGLCFYII